MSPVPGLMSRLLTLLLVLLPALLLTSCNKDTDHCLIISVADQKMMLLRRGQPIASFPISTSKYGLGDFPGSNRTPTGLMEIAQKFGDGAAEGAVFKSRQPTGEIVRVNAPGRDPIVTRILWLKGTEPQNSRAFERMIYIHGTPEEKNIGKPVSYGCVRMRSRDVVELYRIVGWGARVYISERPLAEAVRTFRMETLKLMSI